MLKSMRAELVACICVVLMVFNDVKKNILCRFEKMKRLMNARCL